MLITCAGVHGSGKTTIARKLADIFKLNHYSTGLIFREMAKEKKMTLVEFSKLAEKNLEIDKELDERIRKLGLQGNAVIDGQLCWYFLKDIADWKILLICDDEVRFNRIYQREIDKGRKNITLKDIKDETITREEIERSRFKILYNIDLHDFEMVKKAHDIIVDTTSLNIKGVVENIIEYIK
ncbi:MAG: (d)CMP kinase [Promethearchaeota archaeon]